MCLSVVSSGVVPTIISHVRGRAGVRVGIDSITCKY